MHETLQEYADSRGVTMRVDREAGILKGVKILGLESRNGRSYLPQALEKAARLYEGAKVNVNHPKGSPLGPRDYQDRIGMIRNVVVRECEGLFGDLHYNPKHTLAEQLAWDAEHAPENVGFSHNVQAQVARRGDRFVVETIVKVQSVDLVADPATTRGLFEAVSPATAPSEPALFPALHELTLEQLQSERPDLVQLIEARQADELVRLQVERDRLLAQETEQKKLQLVRRLLLEAELPDPDANDPRSRSIVGEAFIAALLGAPDEAAMRRLIEERAQLVRSMNRWPSHPSSPTTRPQSRDQTIVDTGWSHTLDPRGFARAIT